MLKLLLGPDWVANREQIMEDIARDVSGALGGRILLVPELISHDMERRLCVAAGDSASQYAEVLSFSRLSRRVAEHMGRPVQQCLDNGGRIVAMAAAARQLHSRIKAYAAVETKPEFLVQLLDAVDEFKRCCISSEDLMAASRRTEGALAQKLEELSLLLETYDGLCQHGKRDPADQMTWLLDRLEEGEFGESHVFYIDSFPDFTRQHMAVLECLIRKSPLVTVSLNCLRPNDGEAAFEKAGQTASALLQCARQAGVEAQIISVPAQSCPMSLVHERLFQGKPEQTENLYPVRGDSPYLECQEAARRVWELVRLGCRFRDISVVYTDHGKYGELLHLVFQKSGIPLYQSGKEDILQKSVVAAVIRALEAALGGFRQRDVLRYLKSILSPLDSESRDLVENYALMWSIQGRKWLAPWNNHPDGLGKEVTPASEARLARLNQARELAMEPLQALAEGFRKGETLSDQIRSLYDFLEHIHLAERLDELAQGLDKRNDNRGAQILNQLWEILLTAMEQMNDVLGRMSWDSEAFFRLFTLLLSQYDVGTIPPVLDAVTAGQVKSMRCQEEKHLILLGAEEGALPGYNGKTSVLSEQERLTLREMGVPLTDGNLYGLEIEFSEIYGVFCGARESILISCSGKQPAQIYRRLCAMAGRELQAAPSAEILTDRMDAAGYLAELNAEQDAECMGLKAEYEQILLHRDYAFGQVHPERVTDLYGKTITLSASQVDTQASCRFSYFLKYGLRVREQKQATVDPAEFGTYVHAVLEKTGRAVISEGGFHSVSLERTMELARQFADDYAREHFSQIDSDRVKYLLNRNGKELELVVQELWRELSCSWFEPVQFELGFGTDREGSLDYVSIPSHGVPSRLQGFVDRVDVWEKDGKSFFRVVDYKTGKKQFDYCDVFYGKGLQMLLYLFTLEQNGESVFCGQPVAAGVQYFPARAEYIPSSEKLTDEMADKKREEKWERSGLLLADDRVMEAVEPGSDKKKGKKASDGVAKPAQFHLLRQYVFSLLGKMVDEIASGCVEPNPLTRDNEQGPCVYCPYTAVCHSGSVQGRRLRKKMDQEWFWEAVEKEVSNG